MKIGSENIQATLRWRRILFAGYVSRMEDTRLPKCVMFQELVGGGGQKKEWMGCFLDDYSPGRGEMAQNSGTRGGTFHGEMDRRRKCLGWTMAYSSMTEHDGKSQGEDGPNQVNSSWSARHS